MKYLLISFTIALLVGIFAVQNSMAVNVSFLNFSFETSLVIVILMSAAIGVAVACPPAMLVQFRLNRQIKKLNQTQQTLEDENKRLKEELEAKTASGIPPLPAANGQEKEPVRLPED